MARFPQRIREREYAGGTALGVMEQQHFGHGVLRWLVDE
jgi:hypothetical protein